MSRIAIVEIHKEELKFSAGHFMLISASERERMHGHDYQVAVSFTALIQKNGLAFDCRFYKDKLLALCASIDYRFILPSQSEYMQLEKNDTHWHVQIGSEQFSFYHKDAVVLPITNATLEELSYWFLQQLLQDKNELSQNQIQAITIKIFNGRGESGASTWKNA